MLLHRGKGITNHGKGASMAVCMQQTPSSGKLQGGKCLTSLVGSTPLGSNCSRWPREMLTAKRSHQGI